MADNSIGLVLLSVSACLRGEGLTVAVEGVLSSTPLIFTLVGGSVFRVGTGVNEVEYKWKCGYLECVICVCVCVRVIIELGVRNGDKICKIRILGSDSRKSHMSRGERSNNTPYSHTLDIINLSFPN